LESVTSLISLGLSIDHNSLFTSHLINSSFHRLCIERNSSLRIGLSEEIIPIESLPEFLDLEPEVLTDGVVWAGGFYVSEIVGALVLSVVLDQTGRNDVEVVHDVGERGRDI
jgi:hypothetical protein